MAVPVDLRIAIPATRGVKAGTFIGGRLAGLPALDDLLASGALSSVASGLSGAAGLDDALAAGSLAGPIAPAWGAGQAAHHWISIPDTDVPAELGVVLAFSGWCVSAAGDIYIALPGGHNDSGNNPVVRLRLADDFPAWESLKAYTPVGQQVKNSDGYYLDGTPTSRHVYTTIEYVPGLGAEGSIVLAGARVIYSNSGYNTPGVDVFDVATRTWAPRGTYPDATDGQGVVFDGTHIWTMWGARLNVATKTWLGRPASLTGDLVRYPWAHDTASDQLFGLAWMDSEGADAGPGGPGIRALRRPLNGGAPVGEFRVTFNASPALAQFQSDTPIYPDMDYDPVNDRFLFYDGRTGREGRIYAITKPASGNLSQPWNMAILTVTGTPPTMVANQFTLGRFKYVPALQGFVTLPHVGSDLYFFKVST